MSPLRHSDGMALEGLSSEIVELPSFAKLLSFGCRSQATAWASVPLGSRHDTALSALAIAHDLNRPCAFGVYKLSAPPGLTTGPCPLDAAMSSVN